MCRLPLERAADTLASVEHEFVLWTEQGQTSDEIVAAHPQLSLAAVHGALTFYFENRQEMDKLIAEDEAFVNSFRASLDTATSADSVSP